MKKVRKMLMIDDDDVFTFLTNDLIEETSLVEQLAIFDNGLDGFNYLKNNKDNENELPNIILLDLSMPIMDGWQFLEQYTKLDSPFLSKIAIYVYSSSISPDDIERSKSFSRVTDYLIKPMDKDKLLSVLTKSIESH